MEREHTNSTWLRIVSPPGTFEISASWSEDDTKSIAKQGFLLLRQEAPCSVGYSRSFVFSFVPTYVNHDTATVERTFAAIKMMLLLELMCWRCLHTSPFALVTPVCCIMWTYRDALKMFRVKKK